ncbi:MAG: UbiA family prenyltransferase [Saprospiraceae bacterium]|uniref:UbiA family prenyltransferase n=1 Tax=Candidatus Opimibacter skivensis TaxID=2982028 RepID=A0A9D7STD0_9BACT|nr:UbiA family prenyltransferase [Candidatus Opimibacter skivensis]
MIKNLLNIIRWPNLMMLAVIQTLIYLRLLDSQQTILRLPLFIILVLITIILGAGGYVINDYYDVKIDRVNKPDTIIAGRVWTLSKVKWVYFILVGCGAILSVFLAFELGLLAYIFIYPVAVIGLWYYSFALKCKPIIGNVWVSVFCAGVVAIIVLPDIFLHHTAQVRIELWYYVAFAFLSTWYREVVKDIEDKQGDESASCRTFVVKYGVKAGKLFAIALGVSLLASLILWDESQANKWIKLGLNVIQGLTIASMAFVFWAKNNTYYHHASNVIKLVMALGTFVLLLY